ncbi:hypothetical protein RAB80_017927 [Fusarium oxysporum f. sp. vasinfectum]|nr:hypothetical protein RAB80_017927 [Fusarium oxysporum f. sp. vasinfectum]
MARGEPNADHGFEEGQLATFHPCVNPYRYHSENICAYRELYD